MPTALREPLNKSFRDRVSTRKAQMQGGRRRSHAEAIRRGAQRRRWAFLVETRTGTGFAGGLLCRAACEYAMAIRRASLRAAHPAKPVRDPAGLVQRFPNPNSFTHPRLRPPDQREADEAAHPQLLAVFG